MPVSGLQPDHRASKTKKRARGPDHGLRAKRQQAKACPTPQSRDEVQQKQIPGFDFFQQTLAQHPKGHHIARQMPKAAVQEAIG